MSTRRGSPVPSFIALTLSLAACAGLAGCAAQYKSVYKGTGQDGKPLQPDQVKVVRSRSDVPAWTEVGSYQGQAPTTQEAMDVAKRECAAHGADLFILNTEPYESEGAWKVDGLCARTG